MVPVGLVLDLAGVDDAIDHPIAESEVPVPADLVAHLRCGVDIAVRGEIDAVRLGEKQKPARQLDTEMKMQDGQRHIVFPAGFDLGLCLLVFRDHEELDELRQQLEELKAESRVEEDREQEPAQPAAETAAEVETEKTLPGPLVLGKSEDLTFKLSGRVHRMILGVDDTAATTTMFTDSEQGPTMLRADVLGTPSERLSIGAALEVGIRQNRPFTVSQDQVDGATSVNVRQAQIFLDSRAVGRFSLGRGFAAAWVAPEIDLSGTQSAALLPAGMLAPGLKFVDAGTGEPSDTRVLDYFVDVERLLLVDRFRWDSPTLAGVQLSGSVAADSRWDVAFRTRHSPGAMTIRGAAAYQHNPFEGIDRRVDGGLSIRHEPTGLNLTAGLSREEVSAGRTAKGWIVKGGWLADLFGLGPTAFAVDDYVSEDLRAADEDATFVGAFVVQKWPRFGMDVYAGLRRYDIDSPTLNLQPLLVYPPGNRAQLLRRRQWHYHHRSPSTGTASATSGHHSQEPTHRAMLLQRMP